MGRIKGIDVSSHQGFLNESDWNKIKADGIGFAILRVGFTGYGKAKSKQKDEQFENNYAMAKKVGMPVGVYWYSCAVSEAEAIQEANLVLEYIKGKQLELPIFFDTEDNHDISKYSPTNQVTIGRNALTSVVKAFCQTIENAGNYVGIYASTSWFNNQLNDAELSRYDHWIAQWSTSEPTKAHGVWQYSSSGKVNGIVGNVDMNFSDINYVDIMKKNGLNGFSKVENSPNPPKIEPNPPIAEKSWKNYTIQKGDTLSAIANKFGTSVNELANKNGIKNVNLIYAGTTILVPTTSENTTTSNSFQVGDIVKVKNGAKSYSGQSIASFVYNNKYRIDELKGDRAVLDTKGICTAFKTSDLTK